MEERVLTLLLGSPRAGGNSELLADSLAKGAVEKSYKIRKLRLAPMTLKGCVDCRRCWSAGKPCVQNDDMDKVYRDIEDASVIVFVSPVYFFSWSAQIKPVWDRLLPYGMPDAKRSVKGKKTIVLSTAGDNNTECFEGITASFRLASTYMKWDNIGEIYAHNIYEKGYIRTKGAKYLEQAKELGRSL